MNLFCLYIIPDCGVEVKFVEKIKAATPLHSHAVPDLLLLVFALLDDAQSLMLCLVIEHFSLIGEKK